VHGHYELLIFNRKKISLVVTHEADMIHMVCAAQLTIKNDKKQIFWTVEKIYFAIKQDKQPIVRRHSVKNTN